MSVRRNKGFTLIESMVVVAILAIVVALAMPAMQTAQANARVRSAAADIMSVLVDARAQAIGRQRNLTLTAESGEWQKGWVLALTVPVNGVEDVAAHRGLPPSIQVTLVEDTGLAAVEFLTTGLVQKVDGSAINSLTFRVCDSAIATEVGRDITLSRLGRTQMRQHEDATVCEEVK